MIRSTVKPTVFVCNDLADIEAITAMAAAVAGGMSNLTQAPTLLLYSERTTPLAHGEEAVDKLLFCARHRIPITHSPAPMIGGTAPVTLAGAVAVGNAEMLSGLVMHQLTNPGAPFLYGHGVHHLDMKEMISVYGAPEFQLARVIPPRWDTSITCQCGPTLPTAQRHPRRTGLLLMLSFRSRRLCSARPISTMMSVIWKRDRRPRRSDGVGE